MKVCVWFSVFGANYSPPGGQLLFTEGDVLTDFGARQQSSVNMMPMKFCEVEDLTGMQFEDVGKAYQLPPEARMWVYRDLDKDDEGFTAVFIETEDIRRL